MTGLRTGAEIGMGLVFVAGALFNTLYTLRHGAEFYGAFAANAWSHGARPLIRNVIVPRDRMFTALLILFQVVVATAILTRGAFVAPALLAGGTFALVAALFSSPGGTVGNVALAAIQVTLALAH